MNQIEFLQILKIMTKEGSINFGGESDRISALENLRIIEQSQQEYYRAYIISELQKEECLSLEEYDCDSWPEVFEKYDGENEADYSRLLFNEKELEQIWRDSHLSNRE